MGGWLVNALKLETLVCKAAKVQEESKLVSVVTDWLEHNENDDDLTQALAQ